jgi:hypothetical protein
MPGFVVVENLRRAIHHFGQIIMFKAYLEINESSSMQRALRSELQSSGVSLTDCPHNGRKDASDKMIIVDLLAFAIDHPPPATIVLISGDKDFVYALSTLRNRRYKIILIVPNRGAHIILKSQANAILEWRYDVLNQDIWALQQNQVTQGVSQNPIHDKTSPGSDTSSTPLLGQISPPSSITATSQESAGANSSPTKSTLQRNDRLKIATLSSTEPTSNASTYEGYCFSPRAPGFFDLLVEVLEKFRLSGEDKPRRSKVGNELMLRNPLLYHRAGCSNFREFVELAAKEGLVTLGGERGLAWICLNEDYQGKLFKQEQ